MKNKNIYQQLSSLFHQCSFSFFLLILFLLVMSWPFMSSTSADWSIYHYFIYYFSAWGALVLLLFFANAKEDDDDSNNND